MSDYSTEKAEYSKFYQENVSGLVGFLVLQGWTRPDAADCVQEALIAALPPTWATIKNPAAFCRTVAYRKACDLLKQRREAPTSDSDLETAGTPLIVPEFEDLEQRDEFDYWLDRLPGRRQRQVMVWTYQGATSEEIAAELGIESATVRSIRRDARAMLRRFREEGGHIDG